MAVSVGCNSFSTSSSRQLRCLNLSINRRWYSLVISADFALLAAISGNAQPRIITGAFTAPQMFPLRTPPPNPAPTASAWVSVIPITSANAASSAWAQLAPFFLYASACSHRSLMFIAP